MSRKAEVELPRRESETETENVSKDSIQQKLSETKEIGKIGIEVQSIGHGRGSISFIDDIQNIKNDHICDEILVHDNVCAVLPPPAPFSGIIMSNIAASTALNEGNRAYEAISSHYSNGDKNRCEELCCDANIRDDEPSSSGGSASTTQSDCTPSSPSSASVSSFGSNSSPAHCHQRPNSSASANKPRAITSLLSRLHCMKGSKSRKKKRKKTRSRSFDPLRPTRIIGHPGTSSSSGANNPTEAALKWEKLSPSEFETLQEFIQCKFFT